MTSKNLLLSILLIFYTLFGSWLSINTGLSHDEYHEQFNWTINLSNVKYFLINGEYKDLLNYKDKYHGIAFHFISQPIQYTISSFVEKISGASFYGSYLIAKHVAVFIIFSISSIFFYLLCLKISKNFSFSLIASTIYLFYPYLYGHAQINVKDIPFLSIWLINTYLFLLVVENIFNRKQIKIRNIVFLSFLTAFLVSIRISGVIIFFQYIVGLLILFNYFKIEFRFILKKYLKLFLYFAISFSVFIFILNPIFWHNPLELFNSIKWMSKYQQDICTLTLGRCMESLNLPSSYYFIWLFFKLPILIIFGFLLFPLVENKIFKQDKIILIYYLTLLITPILILIIFILKDVALYDELRHIMFLIPMIFLVSLLNIFLFNKKLFYSLGTFFILFFLIENFSINPYQYTWLNSFAKLTKIDKNFEVDYWGISNKNLQKKIIEYSKTHSIDKNICIYGDTYVKEFLIKDNFACFKNYTELDSAKVRPLIAYQNVRNIKRSNPRDCNLIHEETYRYSFSNQDIKVANLWYCD